jgi:hypothetical protein
LRGRLGTSAKEVTADVLEIIRELKVEVNNENVIDFCYLMKNI